MPITRVRQPDPAKRTAGWRGHARAGQQPGAGLRHSHRQDAAGRSGIKTGPAFQTGEPGRHFEEA